MKIGSKLSIIALAISFIPVVIIGSIVLIEIHQAFSAQAFNQLKSIRESKKAQLERFFANKEQGLHVLLDTVANVRQHAFQKLQAIQENKKFQLEQYITNIVNDVNVLAQSYSISQALYQLERAFRLEKGNVQGDAWRISEDRFAAELRRYQEKPGYEDLMLISEAGDIVYTVAKGKELGQNLLTGELKDSHLAKGFRQGLTEVTVQDFEPYNLADERYMAFIIAPVYHFGSPIGVLAIRLSLATINAIVQRPEGMGNTGETYLVGKLRGQTSYRSDRLVKGDGKYVIGVPKTGTDIEKALAGQSGIGIRINIEGNLVISAYAPLHIFGLDWSIISVMELEELLTPKLFGEKIDFFSKYIKQHGYYDLLLIHPDGKIFYSVKREEDYATNILTGKYADTMLNKLVREILHTKTFSISDYAPYPPSHYQPSAFIAKPLLNSDNAVELIIALQLNDTALNEIMQQRDGMGETGETYLIGKDQLMRSNSYLAPKTHSVKASFANPLLGKVDTSSSQAALAGETAEQVTINYRKRPVITAYTPLKIGNIRWALIAEIEQAEAFAIINKIKQILLFVAILVGFTTWIVTWRLTKLGTAPLLAINHQLKTLAKGQIHDDEICYRAKDEISEIIISTYQLRTNFQTTIEQANAIAAGDYHRELKQFAENDELGKALSEMTFTLREITAHNNRQQWLKTGQTLLHEKMSGNMDLVTLAKNIITSIATYLPAQVGLCYLADSAQSRLKLVASYAFNKRKNLANDIEWGEGLVGQVALERKYILLTQVPPDYLTIQFGQGDATIKNIIVIPFSHKGTLKGVIELGSISELSELQLEFLTTIMPFIGVAVDTAQLQQLSWSELKQAA